MKILIALLLCLALATPCLAKKEPKENQLSADNATVQTMFIDDTKVLSDYGIPDAVKKDDMLAYKVKDIKTKDGYTVIELEMGILP